jgi:hypothetical protein
MQQKEISRYLGLNKRCGQAGRTSTPTMTQTSSACPRTFVSEATSQILTGLDKIEQQSLKGFPKHWQI